jgi:rRNA maturation protein Nop10
LNCEDWELELELETDSYAEELVEKLQTMCPRCGLMVLGNRCKRCGANTKVEKYFDPDFEDYEKEMEKDYQEFTNKDNWKEVKDIKDLDIA